MINAPYRESSLGIDIEDPVEKRIFKKINGCKMDIVLYKVEKDNESRCVARFKYNNIEYFIMGVMNEQNFEKY